jgi:hypothetical protein
MASSFGQYTGGIQGVQGISEAGARIGQMNQQGYGALGASLAQGIQAYNENSAKSEAANAKIQMLGQAYADKIAMYSKDPEIAQSGILDSLMAKAKMLQDAPTKGLSQRVMLAHEAETSLAGFGNQLQEVMFLRGREMERVTQQGLELAAGSKTVTDPRLTRELKLDSNKTLEQNKSDALAYLNKVRSVNPKLEGSDEDFLSSVLNGYEQTASKADPSLIPASVTSSLLEQIAADKRMLKNKKESQQTGLVEDFLARGKKSSMADFNKINTAAADVLKPKESAQPSVDNNNILLKRREETTSKIKSIDEQIKSLTEKIDSGKDEVPSKALGVWKDLNAWADKFSSEYADIPMALEWARLQKGMGKQINDQTAEELRATTQSTWNKTMPLVGMPMAIALGNAGIQRIGYEAIAKNLTQGEENIIKNAFKKNQTKKDVSETLQLGNVDTGIPKTAKELKSNLEAKRRELQATLQTNDYITDTGAKIKPTATTVQPKAPVLEVGDVVLGSVTEEQKLGVRERQKQVADFVTSRMGAIDPTDPERKRRMPVVGFDKFYESLVPESEIREFTTDSGMRVVRMNGKWEQIKSEKAMTPAEMRKANVGVFGKQTADGRLVPSEFIPDSGIFIGGLFNGSDSAVDKYQEEMPKLIDARRGVKELQRINDLVGEALMPEERGKALVEEMNLAAMLRTDIVGVGTVSNYEQKLIKDVTERSVNFFSLDSQDRAVLIALAQRVDRRIKNLSAAHGLTTVIKDDTGGNKYQALREQYLREKGIL